MFSFQGFIPASKSLLNRALIVKNYFPTLSLQGDSTCEDVIAMRRALSDFESGRPIHCGEAGTVLRFMAFLVSRRPGLHRLTGHPRLLRRPQEDLAKILSQLGVDCSLNSEEILIQGQGWKQPLKPVHIGRDKSSQFASGLFLNAWNLDFPLEISCDHGVSEAYLEMTIKMLQNLGMEILKKENFRIPAGQLLKKESFFVEPDDSSAFAIAVAAVFSGVAELHGYDRPHLQPDSVFTQILRSMQISLRENDGVVSVSKTESYLGVEANLSSCPDLFPVLAVLCAFAEGKSRLYGAPHLIYKESNRIAKTCELLRESGVSFLERSDGLEIQGLGSKFYPRAFAFNPDQDHRMAMAAGLLRLKGYQIEIASPEVVKKSFPEFWQILGRL